jgi:dihydroxyacid dehydratase/phosphogluconate dehydratase
MADLDTLGGVQAVMKELLEAGMIHGDCMTVTGKTVAEVLVSYILSCGVFCASVLTLPHAHT